VSDKNKTKSGHAPLVERTKARRWKPGQLGNLKGRPRTAKFSEAMRQLLAEVNASGETNAEFLAKHCFKKATGGSARHAELALNYVEGKPIQVEISGPGGSVPIENLERSEPMRIKPSCIILLMRIFLTPLLATLSPLFRSRATPSA
jgi:hypothetical protein